MSTHATAQCPDCGHTHAGPALAGICVGCPCPTTLGAQAETPEAPARREVTEDDLRVGVLAILRHEGYGLGELIDIANDAPVDHRAHGCEWESDHWLCEDEDGKSRHPLEDHAYELAEYLRVAFEAVGKTTEAPTPDAAADPTPRDPDGTPILRAGDRGTWRGTCVGGEVRDSGPDKVWVAYVRLDTAPASPVGGAG